MINSRKKGFTLVELVIVIAVVAILAAVLIPTFSSLVRKANVSADTQAVKQMNTLLAIEEVEGKPATVAEATLALLDSDIDMEDYKPLAKGMNFYWVKAENRIIYVDENNKVVFPAEYSNLTYSVGCGWYSLSGEITEDDSWDNGNTSVSISTGEQLVSLMRTYADGNQDVTNITLTSNIDLKGANAGFGRITSNLTINGGGYTIYGLRTEDFANYGQSATGETREYGYGLFGKIESGSTVNAQNLKIDGAVVSGKDSSAAILAGWVGGVLNISNVEIKNSTVSSENKVAVLIGGLFANASVSISGTVKISNCTVIAGRKAAKVIGYVQQKVTIQSVETNSNLLNVVDGASISVENVTLQHDDSFGWTLSSDQKTAKKNGQQDKLGFTNCDYWYIHTTDLKYHDKGAYERNFN